MVSRRWSLLRLAVSLRVNNLLLWLVEIAAQRGHELAHEHWFRIDHSIGFGRLSFHLYLKGIDLLDLSLRVQLTFDKRLAGLLSLY